MSTFVYPCKLLVNKLEGTLDNITDSVTAGVCSPDDANSITTAVGIVIDIV